MNNLSKYIRNKIRKYIFYRFIIKLKLQNAYVCFNDSYKKYYDGDIFYHIFNDITRKKYNYFDKQTHVYIKNKMYNKCSYDVLEINIYFVSDLLVIPSVYYVNKEMIDKLKNDNIELYPHDNVVIYDMDRMLIKKEHNYISISK